MPSPQQILDGLARVANEWSVVAIAWHIGLGSALVALVAGWRPVTRLFGVSLAVPLLSVSLFAWMSGNPFNGSVFALAAIAVAIVAWSLPRTPIQTGPAWPAAAGVLLIAFGWVYPHFLNTESSITYLYAAPVGLIPCPTLSVIAGLGLIAGGLGSRRWSFIVAATGLVYGVIGVLRLGVLIDVALIVGALALVVAAVANAPWTSRPTATFGLRSGGRAAATG